MPPNPLLAGASPGGWNGAGAGSSAFPANKAGPLFFPSSHEITPALLSFLKLEKGGRRGGREEVTEIIS